MARFFASTCASGRQATSSDSSPTKIHQGKTDTTTPSSTSRWARRPRLRRQCAHEFDEQEHVPATSPVVLVENEQPQQEAAEKIQQQGQIPSRESGSGLTEAPSSRASSRGASETLSAPSPSAVDLDDDILGDISDDDLSWLEAELPRGLVGDDDSGEHLPEEVAGADDDEFLGLAGHDRADSAAKNRRVQARLEPPLELRVEDFECGECIGKGSYSRVFLGTHVVSGTEWALKVVSKRRTFETRENLAHLREEKNIAEKARGSDFLVRTAGTFQNPKSVVFAMEYLPGGDLYQRLADKGTLPLGEAVAWVAQAVLAIEDLHNLNIVHRDVKPENFLMGRSGTLKLTDFGFARELAPGERLFSQFGTPEYVAPEVLNGCGHGKPVDIWALGVLIYELLVGRTPFKAASVDEMYERIAAVDYAFPPPPARRSPSMKGNVAAGGTRNGGAGGSHNKKLSAKQRNHYNGLYAHSTKSPSSTKSYPSPSPASGTATTKFHGVLDGSTSRHRKGASSHDSNISSASSTGFPYSSAAPLPAGAAGGSCTERGWRGACQRDEIHAGSEVQQDRIMAEILEREAEDRHSAGSAGKGRRKGRSNSVSVQDDVEGDGAQDPAAQSLVKSLLQLNPFRRPSIEEIKRHSFFEDVDFDALRAAVQAQADAEEEEAIVNAAIDGGDVWLRDQRVTCISEDLNDNYGGVFAGF